MRKKNRGGGAGVGSPSGLGPVRWRGHGRPDLTKGRRAGPEASEAGPRGGRLGRRGADLARLAWHYAALGWSGKQADDEGPDEGELGLVRRLGRTRSRSTADALVVLLDRRKSEAMAAAVAARSGDSGRRQERGR